MLFHFSEEPNIKVFKPRQSKAFPHIEPAVWAIDKSHKLHYCFPRDCPRVIYWKAEWTNEEDLNRFFGESSVDKIIVVENQWLECIRNVKLYMYTFPDETFKLFEEAKTAGYYISHHEITPIKVEQVEDLIGKLVSENIELRFTPDLYPIRNKVVASTLDFSIIRFSNAKKDFVSKPEEGSNSA
ncbi:hypothetical protein L1N85_26015 [Paenibacillus alkaliterrae]|uniref:DUF6886 family protein n=1 Tax=Paenibacillus alkaliterrae TaxID=320909 RepID=UPI001F2882AC|nr:DUF6886 family protein [Paenibacillus alkaliterrae]MCF2941788.1 hypothetical protein [Paenibacillus alkaliterrae]